MSFHTGERLILAKNSVHPVMRYDTHTDGRGKRGHSPPVRRWEKGSLNFHRLFPDARRPQDRINHMKAELILSTEEIEEIVERVCQRLLPAIQANDKRRDDSILNVSGLAAYLKVDANWIYQRTRRQAIPCIKKGKYYLFRKSDIDTWLNQDSIKPLSPFSITKNRHRHSDN